MSDLMLRNITYAMLGLERSDQRSQAMDGVNPPVGCLTFRHILSELPEHLDGALTRLVDFQHLFQPGADVLDFLHHHLVTHRIFPPGNRHALGR